MSQGLREKAPLLGFVVTDEQILEKSITLDDVRGDYWEFCEQIVKSGN